MDQAVSESSIFHRDTSGTCICLRMLLVHSQMASLLLLACCSIAEATGVGTASSHLPPGGPAERYRRRKSSSEQCRVDPS